MKRLLSCEFNFDTVCVELKFSDGTMIVIDTIAVENEVADSLINFHTPQGQLGACFQKCYTLT